MDDFILILYLGLATSAASVTLTKADVTQGLRDWVVKRLGEGTLLSCPFCTSFWIAAPLTLVYRPIVKSVLLPIDLLVSAAAVVGIAAVVSGAIIQTIPNFKEKNP